MLDSKILDSVRELIYVEIKKRDEIFPEELSRKGRELQNSGNSPETASRGKKIIRGMFTQETKERAGIVWDSLLQFHKANGSPFTNTLASDLKDAVRVFSEEITKNFSECIIKQPCFAKDEAANSILHIAMKDVSEDIDTKIKLYVQSLASDRSKLKWRKVSAIIIFIITILAFVFTYVIRVSPFCDFSKTETNVVESGHSGNIENEEESK